MAAESITDETPTAKASLLSTTSTTSTCLTSTVNGSHEFFISGYSLTKGMGIGKYIASDCFTVGGFDWQIYFYPDGKSLVDNALYVSLFIALASDIPDVRALFELSLLDQSGNQAHKTHTHFGRTFESGPYTLKHRGSMWGYKHFFKKTLLDVSDYLKDDCLSIRCCVGVVNSRLEGPESCYIPVPPPNMGHHFGKLLESGKDADLTFQVDGEIFAAHKLILAARSPVFKAQLNGSFKDHKTDCIQVKDIEAPVFKALMHYIYWDELPNLECLNTTRASTFMAQHLLEAADRYALDRLRMLCESKLCEQLAICTAASMLALADQHHCSQLKIVCLKFIALPDNLKAVMQTDGFEHLQKSCPSVLSELLQYVAKFGEQSAYGNTTGTQDAILVDGSNANARRVKRRTN